MAVRAYDLHPVVKFVRSLTDEFYLRQEAARQLGYRSATLRAVARVHPELGLGPSHSVDYGKVALDLYTPGRIEELRQHFLQAHPHGGRPKMWNPAEVAERVSKQRKARWRLTQAKRLRAAGMGGLADEAFEKVEALMAELAAQYDKRKAEMAATRAQQNG